MSPDECRYQTGRAYRKANTFIDCSFDRKWTCIKENANEYYFKDLVSFTVLV